MEGKVQQWKGTETVKNTTSEKLRCEKIALLSK